MMTQTASASPLASTVRRLCTLVLIAGGGAVLVVGGSIHVLDRGWGTSVDDVLATAVSGLGLVVATWYVVTAALGALLMLLRLGNVGWQRAEQLLGRAGAPVLRRLLSASAGAAIVSTSLLTSAYAGAPEADELPPADLTWATETSENSEDATPPEPLPPDPGRSAEDATAGPTGHDPVDPGADSNPGEGSPPGTTSPDAPAEHIDDDVAGAETYTVEAGDSLWQIAADHLHPDASPAEIAQHWPQWYQANAATIGPEPDHIVPGQQLQPPERSSS